MVVCEGLFFRVAGETSNTRTSTYSPCKFSHEIIYFHGFVTLSPSLSLSLERFLLYGLFITTGTHQASYDTTLRVLGSGEH